MVMTFTNMQNATHFYTRFR